MCQTRAAGDEAVRLFGNRGHAANDPTVPLAVLIDGIGMACTTPSGAPSSLLLSVPMMMERERPTEHEEK